jgi:5-formaminoimidazole-4-carboxamide-1-beta-D-ribofuranosyl 5'-monophosphate synthetase
MDMIKQFELINEGINVPFFGNRFILRWEADRPKKN